MSRPKARANAALDALHLFDWELLQFASWIMDFVCLLGGDVPCQVIIPKGSRIQRYEVDWILNPPGAPRRIRFWSLQSAQIGPYTRDGAEHRLTVKGKQYDWVMDLLNKEVTYRRECAK
jgi:hypothetical protein